MPRPRGRTSCGCWRVESSERLQSGRFLRCFFCLQKGFSHCVSELVHDSQSLCHFKRCNASWKMGSLSLRDIPQNSSILVVSLTRWYHTLSRFAFQKSSDSFLSLGHSLTRGRVSSLSPKPKHHHYHQPFSLSTNWYFAYSMVVVMHFTSCMA